jgi:MFS family permease
MRTYFGLPSTVFMLGAISLLNDAASDAIYPLLPLFFAATFASGPQLLGLIEGAANATAALMQLVSGRLYDKTGRAKPWMLIGYSLPVFARPALALVTFWPFALALRVCDRIGKGLRSAPRDALLARSVEPKQRAYAFGVHRSADYAGAVIGPLAAAALLAAGWSIRDVLIATIVPGVLCVLLTLAIKETPATNAQQTSAAIDWRWHALPAPFKRFLIATSLFAFANVTNMFMLLRAKDAGFTEAQTPLLWAAFSAAVMVLSPKLSTIGGRFAINGESDHRLWLNIGRAGYAMVALGFAFVPPSIATIVVLFALYAIVNAATEGVEKAVVAELVPKEQLGTAFGWFHLVRGVVILPGGALFGLLWARVAPSSAFLMSAVVAAIAVAMLWKTSVNASAPS